VLLGYGHEKVLM